MVSFERLTRGQGSCSRGTSRRVRTSKGEGARNAAAGLNAPTGKWCDECRRGGHATEAGMLVEGEQRHSRQHRRKYGVIIAGRKAIRELSGVLYMYKEQNTQAYHSGSS